MAKKTFRLLAQAKEAGWQPEPGQGDAGELEPGAELELDLDENTERAMVAAGWIEPAEEKPAAKKGGGK
jgi:hypothetical protein